MNMLIHLWALSAEKPTQYRGVWLREGQIATTRSELCQMLRITDRQARTCLDHLKKSGLISVKSTKQLTVITIEKSELCVLKKDKGTVQSVRATNEATNKTTKQATNEKRLESVDFKRIEDCINLETANEATNKTTKQATNEKSSVTPTKARKAPTKADEPLPEFEAFWEQYPKHVAKKEALKAWRALNPSKKLQDQILYDISRRRARGEWSEAKFIPHPATYLRGERWNDETANKKVKPGAGNPFFEMLEKMGAEENDGEGNAESTGSDTRNLSFFFGGEE